MVSARARLHAAPSAEANGAAPETYAADLDIVAEGGQPVARLEGVRLKRAPLDALARLARPGAAPPADLYQPVWERVD